MLKTSEHTGLRRQGGSRWSAANTGGCQEEHCECLPCGSRPWIKVPRFLRHIRTEESRWDRGHLNTSVPTLDCLGKGPRPPVVPGEGASPLTRKYFQGWTRRAGEGVAVKITSACRGRNCDRTRSEAEARRGCAHPSQPAPFAAPGPASYITRQASLRAGRAGQAARTVPAARGPSSPTSARGPSRAREAATAPAPHGPGPRAFGFRPWRSHNPRNQHTRHHNKGGDAAATPGWED